MSAEHKRPLYAFTVVALLCALFVGNALRSEALVGMLRAVETTVSHVPDLARDRVIGPVVKEQEQKAPSAVRTAPRSSSSDPRHREAVGQAAVVVRAATQGRPDEKANGSPAQRGTPTGVVVDVPVPDTAPAPRAVPDAWPHDTKLRPGTIHEATPRSTRADERRQAREERRKARHDRREARAQRAREVSEHIARERAERREKAAEAAREKARKVAAVREAIRDARAARTSTRAQRSTGAGAAKSASVRKWSTRKSSVAAAPKPPAVKGWAAMPGTDRETRLKDRLKWLGQR